MALQGVRGLVSSEIKRLQARAVARACIPVPWCPPATPPGRGHATSRTLLLHWYLCPYLGHGHGPLWPGQGHLPPRLRLLLVSSWPKRKQPEQKQGIKRMPKTRVHNTLCKVPARSQPTLTTQELQFYSWSRELIILLRYHFYDARVAC